MARQRKRDRRVDAFIGFLLGLGAPLGWIAVRFLLTQRHYLTSWLSAEFNRSIEIYVYLTIATVAVFTLFGYILGRRSDDITHQSERIKDSLEKVNLMAMTDSLTGLRNARYLHDHLLIEMESAKRYGIPLTCLLFDIDDFKRINDTYGHPSGDVVLADLAKIVQQCIRRVDLIGRLGGEEFLAIMPHTSCDTAFVVGERIRQAVQRWPFKVFDADIPVTVSIGAACFPGHGLTDKSAFLKAADNALYQAKRAGKNRTVIFKDALASAADEK